jgi:hypothetical protein
MQRRAALRPDARTVTQRYAQMRHMHGIALGLARGIATGLSPSGQNAFHGAVEMHAWRMHKWCESFK